MTTENHGYTKSSDEYLTERREKVRREREKLTQQNKFIRFDCPYQVVYGEGHSQWVSPAFERCDYESFSKSYSQIKLVLNQF